MKKNGILVLSLCAMFLFYKYIAQLFPSLIATELMSSYGYDGVMLAVMASSYYYSYTIMQIGAGFIIDRFSIRIPMFLAIFTISIMLFGFTHTENFYLMCLSRAFMGIGAAFATVTYMKCASYYTTKKTFGLISSLLATATMLGAACGGTPIALLFNKFGWLQGLNLVAIGGLIIAFLILFLHKPDDSAKDLSQPKVNLSRIKDVIAKKDNWFLLLYSGLTFSPVAILGGLWGTPFLTTKYNLNATSASLLLSIMFIGLAVGAPLWALFSIKAKSKKRLMHFANIIAFITLSYLIFGTLSYDSSLILFFIFGFSVGCFMISFEICREINSFYIMGLSVAFINSGEGLVGSILEPLIGYILDILKVGNVFSISNYQVALTVLPCCFILSSIALAFIKRPETV